MDDAGGTLEAVGHHRRVVTNALAKLLPFGGTFTELYNAYIPTRRARRQVALIESLQRKVERLGARIDESRILSEPYADVFEDVMASVATRQGLEKRDYYASVLANALTPEAPEYDRQLRLVACLDDLRPSHLRLLAIVVSDLKTDKGTRGAPPFPRRGVYVQLPVGTDDDAVGRDWRDLVAWDVLEGIKEPIQHVGGELTYLSATITEFGKEFAAFVGADENS